MTELKSPTVGMYMQVEVKKHVKFNILLYPMFIAGQEFLLSDKYLVYRISNCNTKQRTMFD